MAGMRNAVGLLALLLVALKTSNINVAAFKWESGWSALVTGGVFCDCCLKHEIFPFSYPLQGSKVSVKCYDSAGVNVVASTTATTDFFGGYAAKFEGVSDLGGCKTFVESSADSSCNVAEGVGLALSLASKEFSTVVYIVDTLFCKPVLPKDFCPGPPDDMPKPPPIPLPPKPPAWNIPPLPPLPPFPPFPWNEPKTLDVNPNVDLPGSPSLPSKASLPFSSKAAPSTCQSDDWLNPGFLCYHSYATAQYTTVGPLFGEYAEEKFPKMSISAALQSDDELLKQAVAAMLNAKTNEKFYATPEEIKKEFGAALRGSEQLQWDTAWFFKQYNAGYGRGQCLITQLTACKPQDP